ncbi:MAG TPA: zinc-ribbon domain-containing protein [Blastocatellia bacterium]|nr:zinc-ribbon domain-containing protein [Blastocatellia bacterium]
MILTCPKCSTRLKLEASALPTTAFNVSCPQCQTVISVTPPAEGSASAGDILSVPDAPPAISNGAGAGQSASASSSFARTMINAPSESPDYSNRFAPPGGAPDYSTRLASGNAAFDQPARPAAGNTPGYPARPAPGTHAPQPAPPAATPPATPPADQEQDPIRTLASLLASALSRPTNTQDAYRPASDPEDYARHRKILFCPGSAEDAARVQSILRSHDYELTIVESAEHAIEMLQISSRADIVMLSPDFQVDSEGSTAVLRFISALNPERRRRLFVLMTSPNCKTADVRAAFNQGVNLLVNSQDLQILPLALSKGIRDFNELYRAFNEASGAKPF